jgi:hypothetical protein
MSHGLIICTDLVRGGGVQAGCMSLAGHSQVRLGGVKGWRSLRRPTAGLAADTGRVDETSAPGVPLSRDGEVRWRCWSGSGLSCAQPSASQPRGRVDISKMARLWWSPWS